MPDQISVSEFIAETTEDYNSPTTSSFTTRLHNCRNTVTLLEEVSLPWPLLLWIRWDTCKGCGQMSVLPCGGSAAAVRTDQHSTQGVGRGDGTLLCKPQ
ncbi:Arf-GAP with SH3 domain, ANK repeat and PH domain-containing protein 1 [Galemys pyrenaicus]|uniref:Arf-GAP with SH3 domain, ANK repeat and PH domain-containing protein 1 n=1 Tax=Galemys pyrenaicus TaxID=202257 RepID=A0A8J6AE27_GALPY|nr:Arf-GAP with SH3 domain, ANK repeat and PH domain-containing protein 1 [Galemys pyrenaicus]